MNSLARNSVLAVLLFCFVTGSFVWFRGFSHFYWDDTSSAAALLISPEPVEMSLASKLQTCVHNIQGDGYRPISCWIRDVGRHMAVSAPEKYVINFVSLNALIQGLAMVVLFLLSIELGLQVPFALLAVTLFYFSPPNLTGGLVISSGLQILVTLLMVLGTLLYVRFQKYSGRFARAGLIAIFLFGPYVREFVGVLPLIVLIDLWLRGERSRWRMGGLVLSFAHGLFPTALPKLFVAHQLPLRPVFKIGNLAAYLSGDNRPKGLQFRIFLDLFSLVPPSLLLVVGAFGLYCLWRFKWSSIAPRTRLIWIFFGLAFLPFLKIFNEQVHLGYALLPLSVLIGVGVQEAWAFTQTRPPLRVFLAMSLALAVGDQAMNFFSVKKVNQAIYEKIENSSAWFQTHLRPNDNVISQAHHLMCVYVYSKAYFHPWRSPGNEPGYSINEFEDLKFAMSKSPGDFYFFDVRSPETKDRPSRRIPFFDDARIEKIQVQTPDDFSVRVFFLDPIRNFLPQKTWVWLGSPDLEFDFYRGPARDGKWFTHEVAAIYTIFKISRLAD